MHSRTSSVAGLEVLHKTSLTVLVYFSGGELAGRFAFPAEVLIHLSLTFQIPNDERLSKIRGQETKQQPALRTEGKLCHGTTA